MPLYSNETTSRILHKELCSSPECKIWDRMIRPGMRLVTLKEFNPRTNQPGKTWKRHADCPPLEMEKTRLSDQVKKG